MPAAPAPFGSYLLLERINVGGMAEVFKAKKVGAEGFEKLVAIKRILTSIASDDDFVRMFVDEARISSQLAHANIVQTYDFGRVGDDYYLALEYVPGGDLRAIFDRLRRRGESVPPAIACYVLIRVAEALDYAHRKRDAAGNPLHIIHRDVSPQNVLVSFEGEVKIVDFGIARAVGNAMKTQAGILKGKFGYMSPEQVRGLPIDHRSDLFSAGTVLWELLAGERAFIGENDYSVLEKVRSAEVRRLSSVRPDIPPELERIVHKALAREPDDRYQHACELGQDLQRFLYSLEPLPTRESVAAFTRELFAEEYAAEQASMRVSPVHSSEHELEPASRRPAWRQAAAARSSSPAWSPSVEVADDAAPHREGGPPSSVSGIGRFTLGRDDSSHTLEDEEAAEDLGPDAGGLTEATVVAEDVFAHPRARGRRGSESEPLDTPWERRIAALRKQRRSGSPRRPELAQPLPLAARPTTSPPPRASESLPPLPPSLRRSRGHWQRAALVAVPATLILAWAASLLVSREELRGERRRVDAGNGVGTLILSSLPWDAEITLDGKPLGDRNEPFAALRLPAEVDHHLVGRREGFRDALVTVRLAPGERRELRLELAPLLPVLTIQTAENATILVDNVVVGRTTAKVTTRPGTYRLRVESPCHTPVERLVHVGSEDRTLDVALEPIAGKCTRTPPTLSTTHGYLALTSDLSARVHVNGTDLGRTTPIHKLPLPVGSHTVRLVSANKEKELTVEIAAGRTHSRRVSLR